MELESFNSGDHTEKKDKGLLNLQNRIMVIPKSVTKGMEILMICLTDEMNKGMHKI
ncbi:hypothetical protein KIS4809_5616 [Bacillus sp. ZZV12-4809]|nr:hypothetical protein KIS4809_5616 [Bacillus sp. ZZV12-4809]